MALCQQKCRRTGTLESNYCSSNFGKNRARPPLSNEKQETVCSISKARPWPEWWRLRNTVHLPTGAQSCPPECVLLGSLNCLASQWEKQALPTVPAPGPLPTPPPPTPTLPAPLYQFKSWLLTHGTAIRCILVNLVEKPVQFFFTHQRIRFSHLGSNLSTFNSQVHIQKLASQTEFKYLLRHVFSMC